MINSKITKQAAQLSTEERVIKLLEGIDWKLWEMYNMMKDDQSDAISTKSKKSIRKTEE
jgi:hypothetical protein